VGLVIGTLLIERVRSGEDGRSLVGRQRIRNVDDLVRASPPVGISV